MRDWQILLSLAAICIVVLVIGLAGTSKKVVRLAGSTAFLPFAEQLAEAYMETHTDIIVDVQGGGSATGIMASLAGIVDIGMVDLLTLPRDVDALQHVVVARDGIAVIIHPTNPITNITSDQLTGIFNGSITNWASLGGEDGPIRVISREEGSGTRKSFDTLVLKKEKLIKNAMFQDSNGTIRETVKQDPQAVGYVSIGFLDTSVKGIAINTVEPTNDNVISGAYTIARPIYFLRSETQTPQANDFVMYVLGPEGQQIIAKNGLIPVRL